MTIRIVSKGRLDKEQFFRGEYESCLAVRECDRTDNTYGYEER